MMKKLNCILLSILFNFVFLISIANAASTTDTFVTLDLTIDSNTFIINSSDFYALNGASANLDGVQDNPGHSGGWIPNPVFSVTAQVTSDSIGMANTTSSSVNSSAHSRADGIGINTPPDENVSTDADSTLGFNIQAQTNGNYTFNLNYQISNIFNNDFVSESNSAYSHVDLRISSGSNIIDENVIIQTAEGNYNGSLSITANLVQDQWYFIQGHTYTSASANSPNPVPVPSTSLLLSLGLLGLTGVNRRKK